MSVEVNASESLGDEHTVGCGRLQPFLPTPRRLLRSLTSSLSSSCRILHNSTDVAFSWPRPWPLVVADERLRSGTVPARLRPILPPASRSTSRVPDQPTPG